MGGLRSRYGRQAAPCSPSAQCERQPALRNSHDGLFATGVATSWTEAGTGGKDAPDTSTRRAGRFRRSKRLNYLRRCRAASRSATVAFATVPAAAAIAAAMFGSSSAAFAPLNALAFMSRVAARRDADSPLEGDGFEPSVPTKGRRIYGPGSDHSGITRRSARACWRRRGPRDCAVDAGLRNEQGPASDMMLADQWRADAIMCVQPL